ncbi:hypothetical protein [Streptomyces sp. NPDC056527]|uniref:hypothetical protein n=1 Tax=Streptomyces sp. NPDC056527 TaxID=3345853 RepID=UPI0036C9432C
MLPRLDGRTAVVEIAAAKAAKLGIDQTAVRRIFEDQIAANKAVQRSLHARWQEQPTEQPTHRPSLTAEVRPIPDRVDRQLLTAVQKAQPLLSDTECRATLDRERSSTAKAMALDAIHRSGLDQSLAHTCQTD